MRKLIRFMFVGWFTPENIPNKRVRRAAITSAYAAGFYSLQVQYYQSKQRIMAQEGLPELTFTGWLRYQDFQAAADILDIIMGVDTTKERQRVMWEALPDTTKQAHGYSFETWYANSIREWEDAQF